MAAKDFSGLIFPLSAWFYGLRTVLAVALALLGAFLFQLQESGVAATTVVILANPIHGLVLSKGLWRFCATLIGGIASIALVAFFIQVPEVFVIALALWSGIFTALGSFLKHHRVYAAALTGYTVAIVTLQVVDDPLLVFEHTIDRVEAICIGIGSAAFVTGIFASRTSSRRIESEFNTIISDCLCILGYHDTLMVRYRGLMTRLRSFDAIIEATLHEPSQQAANVHHYKRISPRLVSLLMLDLIEKNMYQNALVTFRERSIKNFGELARYYEALRQQAIRMEHSSEDLIALLGQSAHLSSEIGKMSPNDHIRRHGSAGISGDIRRAILNGIRSTVGALTAGYYWIYSGAPHGAYILSGVILTSCLLATSDNPKKASLQFASGVVLANVAAIACTFCLLPRLTEFMLLIGGLGAFIIPGCLVATKPKYNLFASGYLIFFMIFISLNNVATFDAVNFININAGWALGALYSAMLFRTIFPSVPTEMLDYHARVLMRNPSNKRHLNLATIARYEERVYRHATQIGTHLDLNALDITNPALSALKDAFVRMSRLNGKAMAPNQTP